MREYLLSIQQPDGPTPPPEFLDRVGRDIDDLIAEMKAAGAWVYNGPLAAASSSTVLRLRDGELLTTDGPYVEGKEHVGGLLILRAPDLDVALEWAGRFVRAITLPIEVRPFQGTG